MLFEDFIKLIPDLRKVELLGKISHAKMLPPTRKAFIEKPVQNMPSAKRAGVLALFYPNAQHETCFVLTLRKTYKGVHSAQVSFPGGKKEPTDNHLEATAIRETFEEVGIPKENIQIIKALSKVYIPPSNFYVSPFWGFLNSVPHFTKQEDEVEEIIEVKLADLLNDNNLLQKQIQTSYNVAVEVPTFQLNNFTVWGATAMMLSEIKDVLKQLL
ncbi:CoA pyrophosphatase [Flavobacteriaceae bacterium MHTCC 0001]